MHEFTFYQVTEDNQLSELESGEKLVSGCPKDSIQMGSDRTWFTGQTQAYRSPNCTVHLAFLGAPAVPHPSVTDGSFSLDLQVSPAGELLSMGWSTDGTPISGQLVDRNEHGDRILLPWMVERVETCTTSQLEPVYSAIHVCWCKPLAVPALAVA